MKKNYFKKNTIFLEFFKRIKAKLRVILLLKIKLFESISKVIKHNKRK